MMADLLYEVTKDVIDKDSLKISTDVNNCSHPFSYQANPSDLIFKVIVYAECITIILSFILILIFYFIYKHKRHEHALKDAISKCWPRWIIIFVLIISASIIIFLLHNFDII